MSTSPNNDKIKNDGYWWWLQNYKHRHLDEKIRPFLEIKDKSENWLHEVRTALFLSTSAVGQRLGMTRAGYARIEKAEANGSLSLKKLKMAAEAMDCELIYVLRPKSKKQFSHIIWEKLASAATSHGWVKSRPEKSKSRALAAISRMKMNDSKFRQDQKWSERK